MDDVSTYAQHRVLKAIRVLTDRRGFPPTVREIRDYCGLGSVSTVHTHLMNLQRAGQITRDPERPRTLRIVGDQEENLDPHHCNIGTGAGTPGAWTQPVKEVPPVSESTPQQPDAATVAVDPDRLTEACQMVRAAGYAIVTQTQHDMWTQWLKQSHARETEVHDHNRRLLWQVVALTDRCGRLLNGSRPRWYRDARRFLANNEWAQPIVRGWGNAR